MCINYTVETLFFFSTQQDENSILHALAAILHIGDITFEPQEEGCKVANSAKVEQVAELLQVNLEELFLCLTTELMVTRGQSSFMRIVARAIGLCIHVCV